MNKTFIARMLLIMLIGIAGCSDNPSSNPPEPEPPPEDPVGSPPDVVASDINIVMRGKKISQLTGDYDKEIDQPTQNRTYERYKLRSTDLGVPFQHDGRTYVLFGDTHGPPGGDAIAYTNDINPEDGLELTFIQNDGVYKPVSIFAISQGAFEVPMEGISIDNKMYIYHTTGHRPPEVMMERSVVAKSTDGGETFTLLHHLSSRYFINVSVVKVTASDWSGEGVGIPEDKGEGLVMFGSGKYRQSNVYLAYQPASGIEDSETIRYFSGNDKNDEPLWSSREVDAVPLFEQPCVGEFSVSYNTFIERWIMLYNCGDPRGINMRTAEFPWGPWTQPQVIFEPWADNGYCHYIHTSWQFEQCDRVHDSGRENEWGGEYGPYQFEDFATGDSVSQSTTIYFTMSTWNPYTVVLMKAGLEKEK